jgi:peptidoglycan/xylan/chitin deacetylase (PgdA/CDA1 family)
MRWNWWRLPARGVPILMYHCIGDPPKGLERRKRKLWMPEAKFRKQMVYLKSNNYETITFAEISRRKTMPVQPVIITFDDGYENNLRALPLLKEFGFHAVFFIVAGTIGARNEWVFKKGDGSDTAPPDAEVQPMMNADQLKGLTAEGHEIGSHTLSHTRENLEQLFKEGKFVRLEEELIASKKQLEHAVGSPVVSFSYPYGRGAYISGVQNVVEKAGYQFAVSIKQGKADMRDDTLCLRRLLIRGDDTMFDFHLNITRGKSRL